MSRPLTEREREQLPRHAGDGTPIRVIRCEVVNDSRGESWVAMLPRSRDDGRHWGFELVSGNLVETTTPELAAGRGGYKAPEPCACGSTAELIPSDDSGRGDGWGMCPDCGMI